MYIIDDTDTGMEPQVVLTESHYVIQNHHGTIEIESAPGKGSDFLIKTPHQTSKCVT